MTQTLRRAAFALTVIATLVVAAAAPSSAVVAPGSVGPGDSGYLVTIAARVCEQYTDVRANRFRDEFVENAEPLGPDTNYVAGDVVNPTDEDAAPQDACKPLDNWTLTLGSYVNFGAGSTYPSTVGNADPNTIVTEASVPALGPDGEPTGGTIAGATTLELTSAQVDRSQIASNFFYGLWLQGGTPSDPLLTSQYGDTYGFAALRCANDFQHADNVEYIQFPTDTVHVNCYAYYVAAPEPPPTTTTTTTSTTTTTAPTTTTTEAAAVLPNSVVSTTTTTAAAAVLGNSVLPATGSSTGPLVGAAILTMFAGAGALLLSRRRSS